MNKEAIPILNELLTMIPSREWTGYAHSDLFYGSEPDNSAVYVGCILCQDFKKEAEDRSYQERYLYVAEHLEKKDNVSLISSSRNEMDAHPVCDFSRGHIPHAEAAKSAIRKGCTFLSWAESEITFTLINLSFVPIDYKQLPGIFNEFVNDTEDPKLTALAIKIKTDGQSTLQLHLLKGLFLLKEKLMGRSLAEIRNNIGVVDYEGKIYTILRFEGIYLPETIGGDTEKQRIEIHLVFAPRSPKNTLRGLTEKMHQKPNPLFENATVMISRAYNKDPEYIAEIHMDRTIAKTFCHDVLETMLDDVRMHANEHLADATETRAKRN